MHTEGSLWERETELERIDAVLAAAGAGHGAMLVFRGDPGLGKTRLLRHGAEAAAGRFTVVSAAGQEQERAYPFALLHQVVESVVRQPGTGAAELARGLDVLRGWFYGAGPAGSGPGTQAALLYAAYWLIATVAEARPLLICLDDLHWADPDSLEAIRFVAQRLAGLPVALVCGSRAWPPAAAELAETLAGAGIAEIRELRPLSASGGERLLAQAMGAAPSAEQASLAADLAGGNPLLIEQLGRVWQAAPTAAPRRWPLLARLNGLPRATTRLLEAASVIGPAFALAEALAIAGLGPDASALEPAEALGLLVPVGQGRWSFVHALLQKAVYESLAESGRAALHRRAVAWLREQGATGARLAAHVAEVARPGEAEAVRDLRRAAEEAEALLAWEAAALYWRQALELCPDGDPDMQFRLGRAHQQRGAHPAACAAFAGVLASAAGDPEPCARAHLAWGFSLAFAGDLVGAREHIAAAEAEAVQHSPALAAETAVSGVIMLLSFGGAPEAAAMAERAWRFAEASGVPTQRAKAGACRAWLALLSGDPRAYRWAIEAAGRYAGGTPDELEMSIGFTVPVVHGVVAMCHEHYTEARAPLERFRELARARGALPSVVWAATFLTDLAWRQGRLHEAFAYGDGLFERILNLPWLTAEPRVHRGRVLMEMGDLEGAAAQFAAAEAEAAAAGMVPALMLSLSGQAALAARRGDLGRSLDLFGRCAALAASIGFTGPDPFRWRPEAAEAMIRAGRLEMAAALIAGMEADATRFGLAGEAAIALRCRALLAAAQASPAEAERDFRAALPLHRQAGDALEEGRTTLALGSWLRRQGELRRARSVLDEASAALMACGAGYWVRQAEAERRAAGGRRRQPLAGGPLGQLTPQEYRVAELVSQGLSNRQIACLLLVSPKTLETHLGHVYAKLGLSSRQGLAECFAVSQDPPSARARE